MGCDVVNRTSDSPFKNFNNNYIKSPSPPKERIIPIKLETGELVQSKHIQMPSIPSSDDVHNVKYQPTTDNQIVPDSNPAPPFIIPPIKINDFFQAEGK